MHVEFTITRQLITCVLAILTGLTLAVGLAACTEQSDGDKAAQQEQQRTGGGYSRLAKNQPGETMTYSPTRHTVNYWVKTWSKPNKLAYVYLQNADGDLLGYYVFRGLPVSYCASLTPPDRVDGYDGNGSESARVVRQAPSVDGLYYGTGNCDRYYGIDATTGAYVEYTAGLGINVLLFDQPLPRDPNTVKAKPLGGTKLDENGKPVKR